MMLNSSNTPTKPQPTTPSTPATPPAESPHPRRFDQSTYNQLTSLDGRLLEAINFDSKMQARKSPTGARYSVKPEAYFAKILGVRRETISDHVVKLERLGILDVTRRKPIRRQWQTNLYKIRSWVWWRLGKLLRGLRKINQRVTDTAHLSNPMKGEEDQERIKGGPIGQFTQQILARWEARGMIKPTVPA
jgi:hypothetical protein